MPNIDTINVYKGCSLKHYNETNTLNYKCVAYNTKAYSLKIINIYKLSS